jgi:hypothetical protein
MFERLQSLLRSNSPPMKPHVSFDENLVTSYRADRTTEQVSWEELAAVEIVTTDAGPFVCDVFLVLHGKGRGCDVELEAEGCKELLERLQ